MKRTICWIVGILVAAVVCGLLIGWLVGRPKQARLDAPLPPPTAPPPVTAPPPRAADPAPRLVEIPDTAAPAIDEPEVELTWEDELDDLILADIEDADRAKKMLELMSKVSVPAQVEIAEHMVNFVMDEEYGDTARLVVNPQTPEPVLDVLFNDLMNRDNELMLPLMLDIARQPAHPMREDARETLELFLDEDYGEDWAKWEQAMQVWLKEQAEEQTGEEP